MSRLFCFGLGYSARHLAKKLATAGWQISGTERLRDAEAGVARNIPTLRFDGTRPGEAVREALASATHVLVSIPPDAGGDPVLIYHDADIEASPGIGWIGYLSTVGVYGDHQGGWVDETTPPAPGSQRSRWRLTAEEAWRAFAARTGKRVQIFRLSGIYGPRRSAIDRLRAGTAQRVVKPGQVFNRIHVEDIAGTLVAAMAGRGAQHIYNVTDDEPAPPQDVIAYAAQLLHMPPPPEVDFDAASLSLMAKSFYVENKRVANSRLRQDLAVDLKFPSYREGLRDILRQSR